MVVSVLLQPGKTDAGALFTSGVSSAAMNPRGTASVLSKLTIITATIFMLSALMLSLPALTGNISVLQTQGGDSPAAGTTDTNSNSENTNSNSAINSDNSNSSEGNSASENTEVGDTKKSEDKEKPEEKTADSEKNSEKADSDKTKTEVEKKEDK
jgi:protein translocase SecG subunit